jgi:hypothetical protein
MAAKYLHPSLIFEGNTKGKAPSLALTPQTKEDLFFKSKRTSLSSLTVNYDSERLCSICPELEKTLFALNCVDRSSRKWAKWPQYRLAQGGLMNRVAK